jgi:AbrB family looped-hinge helix DNA binding protein
MPASTLTSKGRITVPKAIREHLKLRTGHRVDFHVDRKGQVILQPLHRNVRELRGTVRSPHKRPVTIEEMNEAIARGWSGT